MNTLGTAKKSSNDRAMKVIFFGTPLHTGLTTLDLKRGCRIRSASTAEDRIFKTCKITQHITLLHRIYCDTRDVYIYRDYEPIEIATSFGIIDFLQGLIDHLFGGSTENYDYCHILLIAIEFELVMFTSPVRLEPVRLEP
jgi:hypothetical protein